MQLVASPDSEEIEQTRTAGSIAKLYESGANPRQARRGTALMENLAYWCNKLYLAIYSSPEGEVRWGATWRVEKC